MYFDEERLKSRIMNVEKILLEDIDLIPIKSWGFADDVNAIIQKNREFIKENSDSSLF